MVLNISDHKRSEKSCFKFNIYVTYVLSSTGPSPNMNVVAVVIDIHGLRGQSKISLAAFTLRDAYTTLAGWLSG